MASDECLSRIYSNYIRRIELLNIPLKIRLERYTEELKQLSFNIESDILHIKNESIKFNKESLIDKYSDEFCSFLEKYDVIINAEKKEFFNKEQIILLKLIESINNTSIQEFVLSFNSNLKTKKVRWSKFYELVLLIEEFVLNYYSEKTNEELTFSRFCQLEYSLSGKAPKTINKLRYLRRELVLKVKNDYIFIFSVNHKSYKQLVNSSEIRELGDITFLYKKKSRIVIETNEKVSNYLIKHFNYSNQHQYEYQDSMLYKLVVSYKEIFIESDVKDIELLIKSHCSSLYNPPTELIRLHNANIDINKLAFKYFIKSKQ